jgi:hypothetical protein
MLNVRWPGLRSGDVNFLANNGGAGTADFSGQCSKPALARVDAKQLFSDTSGT